MENRSQTPFIDGDLVGLRPSSTEYHNHLYLSRNSPESVIRSLDLLIYRTGSYTGLYVTWPETGDPAETWTDIFSTFAELHAELADRYGISTPGINPIIGKDQDGQTIGYVHTHRVRGAYPAASYDREPQEIDDLGVTIASYYLNKFLSSGLCLTDMRPNNFVYGKRAIDTEPAMYFIDLDPIYAKINSLDGPDCFGGVIGSWCQLIGKLDCQDKKSQVALNKLLDTLDASETFTGKTKQWRADLNGQPG